MRTASGDQGLSCVIPVYRTHVTCCQVERLLRAYDSYPREITEHVQFVIVDDGSPMQVEVPDDLDLEILLVRIVEDIPWNVPGAKNLGVVLSRWPRVFVTDVDHLIPLETLAGVLLQALGEADVFFFDRLEDGHEACMHWGTFLTSRSWFLGQLGLDEDFSGHYGFDDVHFVRHQQARGARLRRHALHVEVMPGGPAHSLERDSSFNADLLEQKTAASGGTVGHSARMLRFSWRVEPLRAVVAGTAPVPACGAGA